MRAPRITPPRFQPLRFFTDVQFALAVSGVQGLLAPLRNADSKLQQGLDYEIRPAGLGKGDGVFALRELDAEEFIARYTGRLWDAEEWGDLVQAGLLSGDYAYLFDETGLVVDAEDGKTSNWPRFVNHSKRRANCALTQIEWQPLGPFKPPPTVVMLQARRRIRAGEELLVRYGDPYWDSRVGRWSLQRLVIDYF